MYDKEQISELCKKEAELISHKLYEGKQHCIKYLLKNAMKSLKEHLIVSHGNIVNNRNIDYKLFIFTLVEELKPEYRRAVLEAALELLNINIKTLDINKLVELT